MTETEITEKTKTKRNVRDEHKDTTHTKQKINENEVNFTINFCI